MAEPTRPREATSTQVKKKARNGIKRLRETNRLRVVLREMERELYQEKPHA